MSAQQAKFVSAWFDEASHTPIIADKAQRAASFIAAMAARPDRRVGNQGAGAAAGGPDGRHRAPAWSPPCTPKLTELLCELTVYDFMQAMHSVHQVRPQTKFRG